MSLTAAVSAYDSAAEWDHFDDGSFASYDRITLYVIAPEEHAGSTLALAVPSSEFSDDSPFRRVGTRFSFSMPLPDRQDTALSWGAIENPTVIP